MVRKKGFLAPVMLFVSLLLTIYVHIWFETNTLQYWYNVVLLLLCFLVITAFHSKIMRKNKKLGKISMSVFNHISFRSNKNEKNLKNLNLSNIKVNQLSIFIHINIPKEKLLSSFKGSGCPQSFSCFDNNVLTKQEVYTINST